MSQNLKEASTSTPTFEDFDPTIIPYQDTVIDDVLNKYDYSLGSHEILLSGSVGSAKSILMAHLCIRHCLTYSGARVLLGRKSLPDLKSTIFQKIIEHLQGVKFGWVMNQTSARIRFANGSEILSRSWSDKQFMKMRSLELSMAVIEELTESDTDDAYREIKMRVGRLPHIKENLIISATNPDSPAHWAYKYFIDSDKPTRHTYYSVTTDNPFLPEKYINQLKSDLDPKMAKRMIYGEWIEIADEIIYYAYDKEHNFINEEYRIDPRHPVWLSWDFNIGEGKPLSLCMFQFIGDVMHIFDEVVVSGMRTKDSLDELDARGVLDLPNTFLLTGDATGKHRDTRSRRSDYEIIDGYFANRENTKYQMRTFTSNPPVRKRHNMVNAQCLNEKGERRLFVYNKAKTVDEGLRLTALKKGGQFIEDDSKAFQHVTTAVGYGLHAAKLITAKKPQATIRM